MKDLIRRNLDGKRIILLFVLSNAVLAVMIVFTIPIVVHGSADIRLFDMTRSGYDIAFAMKLLESLGEDGRHAYLFYQIPVDMFYPLLSGATYCLTMAYFINRLGKLDSVLYYTCWLPLASGICDYFENIGIVVMLNQYPDISSGIVQAASIATQLKGMMGMVYFGILLVLVLAFGIKALSGGPVAGDR